MDFIFSLFAKIASLGASVIIAVGLVTLPVGPEVPEHKPLKEKAIVEIVVPVVQPIKPTIVVESSNERCLTDS